MAKIRKKKGEGTDDVGYKRTDKALKKMETRMSSLYSDAEKDMEKKLSKFLGQYQKADKEKLALVQAEKMTNEEYLAWRQGQMFMSKKMQIQIDSLTEDLVNADKLAMEMVNGELPSIYVTNYNFQGYKAEKMAQAGGIEFNSFTIYNAEAVGRISRDNPDLLPSPKVSIAKDKKWNKTKIANAIQQGIVQGEPIEDIAKRLRDVTDMDYSASVRNARTATIGAQNAGRKDASERVRSSGIEMVDVWSCTYDARTRDTHIALDGEERGADGYFTTFNGDKLEYPGDPNGDPSEVYNCRCRLNSVIKNIDHSKDDELYEEFMQDNFYDDWLEQKTREEDPESLAHMKALEKDYVLDRQKEQKKKYG
jgi:uncharacterized protein with gpF-like domain